MKYILLRAVFILYFLGLPSLFAQVASKPLFLLTKIENPAVLTITEEYVPNFVAGKYVMRSLSEKPVELQEKKTKYELSDGMYNFALRYMAQKLWDGMAGQMSFENNKQKVEYSLSESEENYTQYNMYLAKRFPGDSLHIGVNLNYNKIKDTLLEVEHSKKQLNFGFGSTYQLAPDLFFGVVSSAMLETPESYKHDMWLFRYGAGLSYRLVVDDLFVSRLEASYIRLPMRYLVGDEKQAPNGRALQQDIKASMEILWVSHTLFSLENVIQVHYNMAKMDALEDMALGAKQNLDVGLGYSAKFAGISTSVYAMYSYLYDTLISNSVANITQKGSRIVVGAAYTF